MLKKSGIEPVVTLYHWDMPQSLVDRYNGWYGIETVHAFKQYVDTCFQEFGCYVSYWLTLNENNMTLKMPTFGIGKKMTPETVGYKEFSYTIYHNTNIAHFYAVKRCHEILPHAKIGCMIASSLAYPLTSDPEDVFLAQQHNQELTYDKSKLSLFILQIDPPVHLLGFRAGDLCTYPQLRPVHSNQ